MQLVSRKRFMSKCYRKILAISICIIVFCITFIFRKESFIIMPQNEIYVSVKGMYPYIAIIVDDRAIPAVVQAVNNVLEHIPTDWNVQIITPYRNWPFYQNSSLAQFIRDNRVILTPLNRERGNLSGGYFINLILTSPSFWHQVLGDKVLLFQTDSVLCSNSAYNLTDFLQYDFIGAPWSSGECCNGGLSLRNRRKILNLLEQQRIPYDPKESNEDGWFVHHLRRFDGYIPSKHAASMFAVEKVYHPRPVGVHRPFLDSIGSVDMTRLCRECPETQLIFNHCKFLLTINNATSI